MEKEKIRLSIPVIVEGRYDKAKLSNILDAYILTTDGFGVFNNDEKKALIRRLSADGIIVLCDSDGAGTVIRSYISSIVPPDRIYMVYTPKIKGKEKRKAAPSKEGLLGVEGMPDDMLSELFSKLVANNPETAGQSRKRTDAITSADMYELGLSGSDGSSQLRDRVSVRIGLIPGMRAKSFLKAVNLVADRHELSEAVEEEKKKI